ncbi:hypothetical protein FA95DRAFT_1684839 [Auriscalpium vulgare]|uniref:Uncharacterized protein n=1 Tax=Auriscalpium vulgare TaxID=40419 RepID=A0ACB8R1R5_9AGAM|nr:hypothetical protein FA95DRAFT_1684839 [Auriscalpium vulgare]
MSSAAAQPVSRPKPSEEAPALLAVKSQELFALQIKYDALLENQQHLLKKHKDSIARYKRMKNYMFKISNDGVGGMPLDDGAEMDNESDLELPPCAAPSVSHNLEPSYTTAVPKTPRKNTKRTPCTPKSGRSTLGHAPLAQNVVNSPQYGRSM